MGSWTIAILRGSSDCRLRMFSKWVSSGGQGMALECAIRMRHRKRPRSGMLDIMQLGRQL